MQLGLNSTMNTNINNKQMYSDLGFNAKELRILKNAGILIDIDNMPPSPRKHNPTSPRGNNNNNSNHGIVTVSSPRSPRGNDSLLSSRAKVDQYLVKWRGYPYAKSSWELASNIIDLDKKNAKKIDRFMIKRQHRRSVMQLAIDDDDNIEDMDFDTSYLILLHNHVNVQPMIVMIENRRVYNICMYIF